MNATFSAKYGGRCGGCDGGIKVDDLVTYRDDELVHVDCEAAEIDPLKPGRNEQQCGSCFTFHAGECL